MGFCGLELVHHRPRAGVPVKCEVVSPAGVVPQKPGPGWQDAAHWSVVCQSSLTRSWLLGAQGNLPKMSSPGLVHAAASVLREEGKAARSRKQQPLPLSRPPGPPSPEPNTTPAAEKLSRGPAPVSHRRAERRFGNVVKY